MHDKKPPPPEAIKQRSAKFKMKAALVAVQCSEGDKLSVLMMFVRWMDY